MEKEEIIEAVKKAAQEYAPRKVQGASIFSALIAMQWTINFRTGAVWRLNNKAGDVKKASSEFVERKFGDAKPRARKDSQIDFEAGAKWVVDNIKD